MLDGVGMVRTCLFKEFLEAVHGRSRLTFVATCGSHDMRHNGADRLLAIATIAIGHGFNPLKTLLAPLPTALGALPGVLDGDVG
jgi:hypothetical protein